MFKIVHAITFIAAITASGPAFADLVQFRSAGVITDIGEYAFGEDQIGLFGQPGESLIGKNYVLTSSFDTASVYSVSTHEWYSSAQGYGTPFDTSITINGRTISYHIDASVIFSSTVMGIVSAIGRGTDRLEFQSGGPVAGGFVNVSQTVESATPFVGLLPTFASQAFIAPRPGDYARSHWGFYGPQGATRFQTFSVFSMEINPSPVLIPEPNGFTILLAGLGLLLVSRRLKTTS